MWDECLCILWTRIRWLLKIILVDFYRDVSDILIKLTDRFFIYEVTTDLNSALSTSPALDLETENQLLSNASSIMKIA